MEIFENLRSQNSGCPLQCRVFEGLGRADVVVDTVPFAGALEVGSPAMAVRSSVAEEDEDEDEDEDVVVAFCGPEMTFADMLSERSAILVGIRLLGGREVETIEKSCADKHCANRAQSMRIEDIEGYIEHGNNDVKRMTSLGTTRKHAILAYGRFEA